MIGIGSIIGGLGTVASGIFAGKAAKEATRNATREKNRLKTKLDFLENNRQEIINPYAGVTDLSSMISNPFANLSVATGAAEIQIEEADVALANTLDIMRATGAGAGGATALAQAALRSKKGVAANIEAQEKANQDKQAQGEQFMEQRLVGEQKRLQQADVEGEAFVYGEREKREQQQLDRTASLIGMAETVRAQSQADQTSAGLTMIGGVTDAISGIASLSEG
tara:strand:+ start:487 stop:1158 length:672 start_codon:yes stop_codon:yes gene_type:complete